VERTHLLPDNNR